MGNPDEWLETVRKCEYLPEHDIKQLCEMVNIEELHSTAKFSGLASSFDLHGLGQGIVDGGIQYPARAVACNRVW